MSHYSDDPSHVRMDVFKPSGKWSCTKAVLWRHTAGRTWEDPTSIISEFRRTVMAEFPLKTFAHCTIVCLEPYHPHAHPLMWMDYNY